MPMCQSPRIADVLLRTNSRPPANDNHLAVQTQLKCRKPKHRRGAGAIWRAAVILLAAGLLL